MQNLKPITDKIDELARPIARPQLIRYVSIYNIVIGIIGLCLGPLLGVLTGMLAITGQMIGSQAGAAGSPELAEASGALAQAGGSALLWGLLTFISAIILLVVGIGLMRRMSWSRRGEVYAAGIGAAISFINFITGGGIMNLLWVAIDLALMYLFATDAGIKAELGGE